MRRSAVLALSAVLVIVGLSGATGTAEQASSGSARTHVSKPKRNGCERLYSMRQFGRYAKPKYRVRLWVTKGQRRVIAKRGRCQRTMRKQRRAGELLDVWRARRAYIWRWRLVFERMPSGERSWAWSTGSCESGNDPGKNTGNGYYGAFQFSPRTAWSAGFRVLPHLTSWYEQAVRSIRWKWQTSDEQWPVCGD